MIVTSRKRVKADPPSKKKVPSKKQVSFGAPRAALTSTGFPMRMKVKHRYCETVTVSPTGGSGGLYIFSANGMYDPNITGVGHQPLYFDQMTPLYNHYTVMKSKCSMSLVNHTSVSSTFSVLAVLIRLDAASFTHSVQTAVEQPDSRWKMYSGTSNDYPATPTLKSSFDVYKVFGANALDDEELQGTSGANPVEQQYYALVVRDPLGAGNAVIDVNVVIEYEAMWTERIPIGGS